MEKKPFLTEEQAQEIIQDVPTPFHVYDEKGIRENVRRINKAFSWNKGFREYFAVKALPNPIILQILKEEGCGVDCSSLTELMLSEVCGFTGSDIMFSSNQTPVEDMKKAYELGAYINLDDATMVDFLDRVAGVPENIFCRYNPGGTFQLGASEEGFQVMDKPGDAKYGMTEEQMIDSYKKLMAKGAKNFGIHAFLASNTISDAYYPELAGILFQLAVRVQKATGAHISYINLSGGVGIPYLSLTFTAPVVGLWSPPTRNAPFVCIEPWYGRCDRVDYTGEYKDRDWVWHLEPGELFDASYTIEIAGA